MNGEPARLDYAGKLHKSAVPYAGAMVPIKLPVVNVRCTDCGFCGLLGSDSEEWRRFSRKDRDTGTEGFRRNPNGDGLDAVAVGCFVDAHPITDEITLSERGADQDRGPRPHVKAVIERWRDCDRFIKYHPGLTLYQHYEEARMMEAGESQKRWDLKLLELEERLSKEAWWRSFWLVGVFAIVGVILAAGQLGVAIWVMRYQPSSLTAPPHPSESSR